MIFIDKLLGISNYNHKCIIQYYINTFTSHCIKSKVRNKVIIKYVQCTYKIQYNAINYSFYTVEYNLKSYVQINIFIANHRSP